MLGFMRKHQRSPLIKIVFWFLIFIFVGWGVGVMVSGGDRVNVAATVDGEPISAQTYARAHERMQRVYRELYRENMNPQILAQLNLGQRALDDLVTEMLLKQEAKRLGLQVTDDEVREAILDIPTFQDGARFDRTRYLNALRASRLTPAEFEESQRETLLVTKLEGLLTDGLTASDQEVKNLYALESEKVDVTFVKVPFSQFKDNAKVEDTEVAEYYEKNKERFRKPDTVKIAYVTYDPAHFGEKLPIEDQAIQDYYDAHKDDYEQPERRHLQHILFMIPPDADAAKKDEIKAKAAAVLTEARGGDKAKFVELAKKNSEDQLSVDNGGDLGVVAQGALEAPLEAAAFALANPGDVTDAVESSRGVHIIRLDEIVPGGPKPIADVRDEIVKELRSRGADDAARNALTADLEKAKAGTSLDDIAAAHGLTVTTSPLMSRGQTIPNVKSASLITNALAMEPNAIDQIMDPEPPYFLFKVAEKVPSAIPPLEDVKEGIVELLTHEKTKEAARTAADALLESARKGGATALVDEAKAKGYEVDTTGAFGRNDAIPKLSPAPIKNEVFALTTASPLAPKTFVSADAAVVYALKERIPADASGLTDEKKQALRDQAVARKRQDVLENYRNELRERAEVTINPDVVARAG